jgi:hypothetical protein
MTPSFVSAPPSNEFADAITRRFPPHVLHQAADARSVCAYGRLTPTTRLASLVYGFPEGLRKVHLVVGSIDPTASLLVGYPTIRPVGLGLCPGGAPFQDKRTKQGLIAKVR